MEDEAYKLKREENLRNPKNRYLGIFCHAEKVDSSWGCDWSFQTGVIMFSVLIFACSIYDAYVIGSQQVFGSKYGAGFKIIFGIKVISDIINFITIVLGFIAVCRLNLKYSIISYYCSVLSLIMNTLFLIYILIAMFIIWKDVWREIPPVILLEIGLVMFSWILFCNQVDLGRKQRAAANPSPF